MDKTHTKDAAEAILLELPSVLGAFVREDINGHPREVHVLVGPGPEPRHLARDIRSLLEERLGVFVDQRVISIAQLSERMNQLPLEELNPGHEPGSDALNTRPTEAEGLQPARRGEDSSPHGLETAAAHSSREDVARVIFEGVDSATSQGRTQVRVRVSWRSEVYEGVAEEIEGGTGRLRATAAATLRAATAASGERIRLEFETVSVVQALGRDYALVTALAVSPLVGRHPLLLAGAHPLVAGEDTAAVLAALQASNRVLGLALKE